MNSASKQEGFAIALLLWMIAGMSLMVAAVIHFAQSDIGMTELRLSEARAHAAGRGAVLLALRDKALKGFAEATAEDLFESDDEAAQTAAKQYEFAGGISAKVSIKPANAFVSLNDAAEPELVKLFAEVGGASEGEAANMAQAVIDYRYEYPGFRATEELLMVESMTKPTFDRVASSIHPYRSGALNPAAADGVLAEYWQEGENGAATNTQAGPVGSGGRGGGAGVPGGLVTFESIAEKKRLQAGQANISVHAVDVVIAVDGEPRTDIRIWAASSGSDPVMRMGQSRKKKTSG